MESFQPRAELRDRVLSIDLVRSAGHVSRILPSTSAVLGMQVEGLVLADEQPLSSIGVTGLQDEARRYSYQGPTENLLVRFTPQGAACLGLPAHELHGKSQGLDALWGPHGRARGALLVERIRGAANTAERLGLLEDFLLGLPFERDALVDEALRLLGRDDENSEGMRVARVARAVGLSERQLERRFLTRVGVSPKRYARLLRFERAQRLARGGHSLSRVAFESGYADQPHFIREFRRFAGTTPARFLQGVDFVGL
jgi:AraC-like DNA-binding protein